MTHIRPVRKNTRGRDLVRKLFAEHNERQRLDEQRESAPWHRQINGPALTQKECNHRVWNLMTRDGLRSLPDLVAALHEAHPLQVLSAFSRILAESGEAINVEQWRQRFQQEPPLLRR